MLISAQSPQVLYLKQKDTRLAPVIDAIGDVELGDHPDGFSFIVEEFIGQMISRKAADRICERVSTLAGGAFTPQGLLGLSPEDLRAAGLSKNKASYLLEFASAVAEGAVDFDVLPGLSDGEILKRLTSFRGIGPWTAKMYLLFSLQREDVLPYEDGAFMQSFCWLHGLEKPSRSTVVGLCEKWKPYSSIATLYMYRARDLGMIKTEYSF